jgi:hypothetical protein
MKEDWNSLPRLSKLASVLYADQVSKDRRATMDAIARREGKSLKGPALLSDAERGPVSKLGGVAVLSQQQKRK